MRNSLPSLCVVVPCYNEEAIIRQTFLRLQTKLKDMIGKSIAPDSKLIFVDDGSKDKTWEMLVSFSSKKAKISHSLDTNQITSIESKNNTIAPPPN
ncbi:glycosyltransferase [Helicobacter himalayensis]|uniref:glycosyltransferase n=1 Tax=Helicobacter himalayensis TaxID=1591088 RepID=UPI003D6E998D